MDYSNELLKGVKWVFFDLDDTLWDFSANSDITLKEEILLVVDEGTADTFISFLKWINEEKLYRSP